MPRAQRGMSLPILGWGRVTSGAAVIRTFHAKSYGCLLDVTATLTPLHAFIGPNDSGKSTLLWGMRTVVQHWGLSFQRDRAGKWTPFDPYLFDAPDGLVAVQTADAWFGARLQDGALARHVSTVSADGPSLLPIPSDEDRLTYGAVVRAGKTTLKSARLIRLDPDALRAPSGLIPETASVAFLDDRGHGLGGVYFAIRNRNDDAFSTIVNDVRRHFPTIKGLRVKAITSGEVALEAELTTGARVEAARMSEGLLYYLAFAALRHIDPVSLLLVEEPENGLHPARIAEVVRILRAIVEETGTQVIMATHSPLLVNELQPEEVSVVTRHEQTGTRVTRLHETPDFAERSKIYALGELWIAYANGEDEAPLLTGTEP